MSPTVLLIIAVCAVIYVLCTAHDVRNRRGDDQ